nr:ATP-dependent Clp protease adaptor ClpS [uncultured Carboxylicivirga sp.]
MVAFGKKSKLPEKNGGDSEKRTLTLHNDDINTFDHVIDVLCEVCDHDALQAEQCALITHYKGSCDIMSGSVDVLLPVQEQMVHEKLLVTID